MFSLQIESTTRPDVDQLCKHYSTCGFCSCPWGNPQLLELGNGLRLRREVERNMRCYIQASYIVPLLLDHAAEQVELLTVRERDFDSQLFAFTMSRADSLQLSVLDPLHNCLPCNAQN